MFNGMWMRDFFKNNKFLISFLFVLALTPRIAAVFFSNHSLLGDEIDYSQLAFRILEGNEYHSCFPLGFTNARPPLYPLFIAFIYRFMNHSIFAVKIAQAGLGTITCILIFFISEKIFNNKRISLGAAISYAFYPLAIVFSASLLSETLFTFLLASAIIFLLKSYESYSINNYYFSGLFLGFAALTKQAFLAVAPFLILWSILFSSGNMLSRSKSAVFIMLFMILTIMPWTVRNYIIFKEFIPVSTGGGLTSYIYNNENTLAKINDPLIFVGTAPISDEQKKEMLLLSEPERDKHLYGLSWKFALSNPNDFFKIRLISLGQFWHFWPETPASYRSYYIKEGALRNPWLDKFVDTHLLYFIKILYHLIYDVLFVGMIVGLVNSFRQRPEFVKSLLLIFLIAAMSVVYSVHGADRYRVPVDPYVFLLGWHGLLSFWVKS